MSKNYAFQHSKKAKLDRHNTMCKHDITRIEVAESSRITPFGVEAKVCDDCKQVLEVY